MTRDAVLTECAQHLRASSFEYEQLLGVSVERVWHALSTHIERQLLATRGANVAPFGKFAFVRDVQPLTPVFLLADRFVNAYSVAWKRPPPALVTPAADVSMAVVGSGMGLPKDQTQRTLDAIVAFLGTKLQRGMASGHLAVANVGVVCLDGKALSFAFSPAFVRAVSQSNKKSDVVGMRSCSSGDARRVPQLVADASSPMLQRSLSTDAMRQTTSSAAADAATVLSTQALPTSATTTDKRHRHHHRHSNNDRHTRSLLLLPSSSVTPLQPHALINTNDSSSNPRQVLPRFLLASKSVPDDARVQRETPGAAYTLTLQAAYARERTLHDDNRHAIAKEDAAHAAQRAKLELQQLEERAAHALQQHDRNASVSRQIVEQQAAKAAAQLAAARPMDATRVTILPRDVVASAVEKRTAKQTLCARLSDQVSAKHTLVADKKALEQAETAYFLQQLDTQSALEHRAVQERKQLDKRALLDGWQQQQALRSAADDGVYTTKRIR